MTTTTVTKKQVESLVRRAVRERGADVYGSVDNTSEGNCVYRQNGKPVCLVGTVVSYLTDKPLGRVFDKANNVKEWDDGVREIVEQRTGLKFTPGAHAMLVDVQAEQDAGQTWGLVAQVCLPRR